MNAFCFAGTFEPDVKVVDARHRDHPYAAPQEIVDDRVGQYVAGGLHDDLDAALAAILVAQRFENLVGDALAHRVDQRLAAGQDDAPALLCERSVGPRTSDWSR